MTTFPAVGSKQIDLPLGPETGRSRAPETAPSEGIAHNVVGLFAGIGGIELGLHRAGHQTLLLCENDDAALAVLRKRFSVPSGSGSGVKFHADVTTLRSLPVSTTLITAGFPCQDLSQAGSVKGISGSRSGLVGEIFRLLRRHRVPWVLLENVPFMLQLARGEAMNVITAAFEEMGYKWAYRVIDSRAFGLPQRRRRVYFLAARDGDPREVLFADEAVESVDLRSSPGVVASGFYWTEGLRGLGWAVDAVPTLKGGSSIGIPSPPAIVMPDGDVITPGIVDAERLQGFPRGWTKPAEVVAKPSSRWKLVGNAVNVRAAQWIGRRMKRPGSVMSFGLGPLKANRWPSAAWNVGSGRYFVRASEWPVQRRYISLNDFITREFAKPLSLRATEGFLSRAAKAKLNFPDGFIATLERHRERVRKQSAHQTVKSRGHRVKKQSRKRST